MTDPCDSAIAELARDFGGDGDSIGVHVRREVLAKRLSELVVMARGFREDGGALDGPLPASATILDTPPTAASFYLSAEEIAAGGMTPFYRGDRATTTPSLKARVKFTIAARKYTRFDLGGIWVVEDLLVGKIATETIARLSKGNARARSDVRNLLPETYEESPNAHVARAHGAVEGLGGNASAPRRTEPNEGDPADCPGCGAWHPPVEACPPTDSITRPHGGAYTVGSVGGATMVEVDGKRYEAKAGTTVEIQPGSHVRMFGAGGGGGSSATKISAGPLAKTGTELDDAATGLYGLERALSTPEGMAAAGEVIKHQLSRGPSPIRSLLQPTHAICIDSGCRWEGPLSAVERGDDYVLAACPQCGGIVTTKRQASATSASFVALVSIQDGRYSFTCPVCGDRHENISRGEPRTTCQAWPNHAIALVWPALEPAPSVKREALERSTTAGGTISFEVYPRCSVEDCGDSAVVNIRHSDGGVSPVCEAHIKPITNGDSLIQEITVTVDDDPKIVGRRPPPQTSSMSFADLLRAPAVQRMLERTTAEDAIKALAWCRDLTKDLPAVPERSPRDLRDLTPAEVVQRGIAALRQVGAGLTPGDAAKVADELAAISWPEED